MVNRNLIRTLENDDDWSRELESVLEGAMETGLATIEAEPEIHANKIVEGRVIRRDDEHVLVDIGYKSEGSISIREWEGEDPPEIGSTIQVLVEEVEFSQDRPDDPSSMVQLSKSKAEKILRWQDMMKSVHEGQVVTGRVVRKIKGGLLVDIGVNVFLPASQVDIRRPNDIGDFIGRVVQSEVLKIDETRRNIVVSRRSLIEKQRQEERTALLKELEEGQVRTGIVKNIADFGAFVDLGGIDGLLHITDMSWGRINHPSEMVSVDQEIDVQILKVDRQKEKIALGLKQKSASPWEDIETKFPVNTVVTGTVVNVMSYGAFVKLEDGIEGLVHISEMSWTKRVSHPNEMVRVGDEIDVLILGINKDKQEISLGMKQTQENPWEQVAARYPVHTTVKGQVRNLTNYGAFIELEEGIDGLLHVSDMSWTRKIGHPNEMLEKGQEVECKVVAVDQERRRIALGLKQLAEDPWADKIPNHYKSGQLVTGTVTKITNFGVFVSLEDDLEGLLHISELADHKVENPEEVVKVGDQIEVKILRIDIEERKIGLSRKRVEWAEQDDAEVVETASAHDPDLKGGLGASGPLINTSPAEPTAEEAVEPVQPVDEAPQVVIEAPVEGKETPASDETRTEPVQQTQVAEVDVEKAPAQADPEVDTAVTEVETGKSSDNVSESDVSESDVSESDVSESDVSESDVSESDVSESDVSESDVSESDVSEGEQESAGEEPDQTEETDETVVEEKPAKSKKTAKKTTKEKEAKTPAAKKAKTTTKKTTTKAAAKKTTTKKKAKKKKG